MRLFRATVKIFRRFSHIEVMMRAVIALSVLPACNYGSARLGRESKFHFGDR
jgi:hypothetical protein